LAKITNYWPHSPKFQNSKSCLLNIYGQIWILLINLMWKSKTPKFPMTLMVYLLWNICI
jgi:uncharacterized membrane protein